jgi:phosphate transport system permease protein
MRTKSLNLLELAFESLIRLSGISAIAFVGLIFLFLFREGIPAFWEVGVKALFGSRWYPTYDIFGTLPLILGSLLVTIGAVVIAVPLGLASAIFLREIAPGWLREILKPIIEVLAGIPSVILGFLGMQALSPLIRDVFSAPTGLTALTGSIVLAYMSLPTITSITDDALDAVPKSYRDAALALGATRWQTIWRVVVPAARTGVLTAMMLGVGRAIGETMAVMMITGNAARIPLGLDSILRPVRTMTATIAAEMGEVAQGSTHYHVLFTVGIFLFVITFLVNAIAGFIIFRQKRGGQRLLG